MPEKGRTQPTHHTNRRRMSCRGSVLNVMRTEKRVSQWLIDPHHSEFISMWDIAMSVVLVFTALVSPVEVALLDPPQDLASSGLFWCNRIVDIFFIADMVIQFFLITEADSRSSNQEQMLLVTHRAIARKYLRGWFWIDLISILVSGLDFVGAGGGDLYRLQSVRVLRCIRLVKIVRLLRMSRIIKRYETRLALNYSLMSLMRAAFYVFLGSHWIGCVWALQATVSSDITRTWLGVDGVYCTPRGPNETLSDPLRKDYECVSAFDSRRRRIRARDSRSFDAVTSGFHLCRPNANGCASMDT